MKNELGEWRFYPSPSRKPLTTEEVTYWKSTFKKLLKVGIEVEYNLKDNKAHCDTSNHLCRCVNPFKAADPIPQENTQGMCYDQCSNWKGGSCEIAQEEGCVGVYCSAFKSPCPSCNLFDKGCKSCPDLYNPAKDPAAVRTTIGKALKPTRFVGETGEHGVYKVCADGSLTGDGGIEVATVGRRVEFSTIYSMMKKITDLCLEHGAFVNERCSVHIHLLTSYLSPNFDNSDRGSNYLLNPISELEKPVPEIILANFHQLIRRYQTALTWLSSSGTEVDHITRWEKFRKSILPYSALYQRMSKVSKEVVDAAKSKPKYRFMNYVPVVFNSKGDIDTLHVEARYMDGTLSPAVIAAHASLIYAILLKAVDLSHYGVLRSGSHNYMQLQKEIWSNFCNGDGSYNGSRKADTSNLGPYLADLKRQSKQLLKLVKGTLSEQGPAYDILYKLAGCPQSFMSWKNKADWERIDRNLLPPTSKKKDAVTTHIKRIIDLGSICECADQDEWEKATAAFLAADRKLSEDDQTIATIREEIKLRLKTMQKAEEIIWSEQDGSFVSRS